MTLRQARKIGKHVICNKHRYRRGTLARARKKMRRAVGKIVDDYDLDLTPAFRGYYALTYTLSPPRSISIMNFNLL